MNDERTRRTLAQKRGILMQERKQVIQALLDSFNPNEKGRFISRFSPEVQKRFADPNDMVGVLNTLTMWNQLDEVEEIIRSDPLWVKRLDDSGGLARLDTWKQELNTLEREEVETPRSLPPVTFTNRWNEFKELNNYSGFFQVWLIDAPIGYGKTEFLKEIQRRSNDLKKRNDGPGGDAFFIEIDRNIKYTSQSLANGIAGSLGCQIHIEPKDSHQRLGVRLAGCILGLPLGVARAKEPGHKNQDPYSVTHGAEVTLLLDNIESLDDMTLQGLAELISGIFQEFEEKLFFFRQNRFRVILAGMNLANRSSAFRDKSISFQKLTLSPFEFSSVEATVRDYSLLIQAPLRPDKTATIAAYIMYLTGGHPGAMAKILQKLAAERFAGAPQCFQDEPDAYLDMVQEATDEVVRYHLEAFERRTRDVIKDPPDINNLLSILEALSAFRRYGTWLLEGLIAGQHIKWNDRAFQLHDNLRDTVARSKEGFLSNDLSGRLLAIRLHENKPDQMKRLKELCRFGLTQYKNHLLQPQGESVAIIAVELLFQELQYQCYVEQKRGKELEQAVLKAANDIIDLLQKANTSSDVIDAFINALKQDWELSFLFNFFASESGYKPEPFVELEKSVDRKNSERKDER